MKTEIHRGNNYGDKDDPTAADTCTLAIRKDEEPAVRIALSRVGDNGPESDDNLAALATLTLDAKSMRDLGKYIMDAADFALGVTDTAPDLVSPTIN